ncbi:unnamed protein product [Adineta steineri]|uniref:ubiquitinyl hydrolase 1 n=1 Tax=Adineta steineri TaxID=433720 RepID=A0A813XL54_9BILA|nr:unnamed protein product [Adineta steineri]CAF1179866.1 unnamed protein product [Adineta steineri]CAF1234860.1 unnamed protein product [Adineta steineri]
MYQNFQQLKTGSNALQLDITESSSSNIKRHIDNEVTITVEHETRRKRKIPNSSSTVPDDLRKQKDRHGLCGLKNLGNTCFMNSAIQCLSNVSQLKNFFLSDYWHQMINHKNPLGTQGQVAQDYADLMSDMWLSNKNSITPKRLKTSVANFAEIFTGYSQQDAHEFMHFLLDALHEDLKDDTNDSSPISKLFYGRTISIITCVSKKRHVEQVEDLFTYLPLTIPTEQPLTVQQCLTNLSAVQIASSNSEWFCSKCRKKRQSKKQMYLFDLPRVLILQIKRFNYGTQSTTKITKFVQYPLELNLTPFIIKGQNLQEMIYDLIAVCLHTGSLSGGHYFTYAKHERNDQWYCFNDSSVTLQQQDIINQNAYILLYKQR